MERGLEIAERLNTGIVHVNDQTLNNDAYAPFGGTGSSGNGSRFGSQSSWDEFTSGSGSPPGRRPTASRSEAAFPGPGRGIRVTGPARYAIVPVCDRGDDRR
jgi:hypothetical protein